MADLRFGKAFDSLQLYWLCSLAVLSLLLAIGEGNYAAISGVRQALNYPLTPLLWVREFSFGQYHNLNDWRARNARMGQLEQQHERMGIAYARTMQELRQLQIENAQLRELTELGADASAQKIYAQIVRLEERWLDLAIVISAGSVDGVRANGVVLSSAGVVGQVSSAAPSTAQVIPITSHRHHLPVRLGSDQGYYNARGVGDGRSLSIDKVRQDAQISVGDTVYTSGLGKRFAAGLMVGRISAIQPISNETFSEVLIDAAFAAAQRRFVVVLQDE